MTLDRHDLDALTQLLKDAATAHHEYEALIGHPDADWQKWYAEYLILHSKRPTIDWAPDARPLVVQLQGAFETLGEGY